MIIFASLAILGIGLPLAAQEDWCSNQGFHTSGMVTHSEVREERLAAATENIVDPAQNGSIRVHGWANADIQVKACIQSAGPDMGAAEALAKQVTITDGPGRVVAQGPSSNNGSGWSVSYEIWAPASANLTLKANNGSIQAEGVMGRVRAHTLNGSLSMKDVGGDIEGETTNGSLNIDLATTQWHGQGLKLNTVNGSIHLHLPANFSADVEASTVNGRIHSDFANIGDMRERHDVKFTMGAGGSKIEARTVNGSVQISKQT